MFDKEFYPTPFEVAKKLILSITDENGKNPILSASLILEPSAGKGDLIAATNQVYSEVQDEIFLSRFPNGKKRFYSKKRFEAIERNPDLQNFIRGMDVPLISYDFLNFVPEKIYDAVLMNPPFSNGLKHFLKAWEVVADGGVVACILPSGVLDSYNENLRNTVWEAKTLLDKYGKVVHLGKVFENAERKTSVDVSAFYLFKPEEEMIFDFFRLPEKDAHEEHPEDDAASYESQVATKDMARNLVMAFNKCRELFNEIGDKVREFGFYYDMVSNGHHEISGIRERSETESQEFKKCIDRLRLCKDKRSWREVVNEFVSGMKIDAWMKVFDLTDAKNLMTEKVRKDFTQVCKESTEMAFSEENIYTLLNSLLLNQEQIMRRCVTEAFDLLTSYDAKNANHKEGWKTNDSWRINKKVIVPDCFEVNGWSSPFISYYRERELNDIDRSLAFLEGRKFSEIEKTVGAALREHSKLIGENKVFFSEEFESTYFRIRMYKKGTIHLLFKDLEILKRFNFEAAKGKAWLPDDYKWRETQQRKNRNLLRLEA